MHFLITITDIDGVWEALSDASKRQVMRQHNEFKTALMKAGKFVDALHLYPRSSARTVRRSADGRIEISDGPYHDQREYMGGGYVISADSLDEAVDWACKARFIEGANEVRQIWK